MDILTTFVHLDSVGCDPGESCLMNLLCPRGAVSAAGRPVAQWPLSSTFLPDRQCPALSFPRQGAVPRLRHNPLSMSERYR